MLKRIKELLSRRGKKPSTGDPPFDKSAVEDAGAASGKGAGPPIQRGPRVIHRPIPESDLDRDAVKIVQRLTRFDHSAYLVGGCVRDLLLDQKPKDFDIGTSATPRQIKRLFRNSRIIGRRFRLAHVYFQNGKVIEVATFRARNGDESDRAAGQDKDLLIRDDNLFGTPEEDALRRDFTINSMFYDLNKGTVLDHADGLGDLRRKLIRTIGDPEIRFLEDPIRILRAIKFAARLGFRIEAGTLKALKRTRHEIPKAASPRIVEEINRFCRGGAARGSFELLRETGVFEIILPELAEAYGNGTTAWELLYALLERIDQRHRKGHQAGTGSILSALLLPAMRQRFGWHEDGSVDPVKGIDTRESTDLLLRPLALRLRLARKDQEHCRQTLNALYRMVPGRGRRRSNRRSMVNRECFPDSLWMLNVLDARFGGQFTAAAEYWRRAAEAAGRSERRPSKDKQPGGKGRTAGPRRRPRSRRAPSEKESKAAKPADKPPAWDDDYFFTALPSAPEMSVENGKKDRYGAEAVAPREKGDRPKRKRRPRRRRKKRESSKS
jgi:poly(A) polymerase